MQELELLYKAFHSEYGISVPTSDPKLLMQRLYKERKKHPELSILSMKVSPTNPTGEIVIVKSENENAS